MYNICVTSALDVTLSKHMHVVQGGDVTCDGRNDVKDYSEIISAMKVLTYTDEEIWMLHKIIAALLHIGNITYRGRCWWS